MKHLFIQQLEKAFKILNTQLFSDKLQSPEFVLHAKKKVIVRWIPERQQLVVGGDLAKVDSTAFLAHLLHEMVHIYNHERGIVDCRSNQYHNKFFCTAAIDVGLIVVYNKTHGWGVTTINSTKYADAVIPTEESKLRREQAFAAAKIDKSVFQGGKSLLSKAGRRNRQTTYFLKYKCTCPGPHNSIRSGRRPDGDHPLNIRCLDCGANFVCDGP